MKSIQGSPFLSILFFLYFIVGMIFLVVDDLRSSEYFHPFLSSFFPIDIVSYLGSLMMVYSLKSCELVCSSMKIFIMIFLSYVLDIVLRILLNRLMTMKGNGPISILVSLFMIYCIMFPCVKARFFGMNEKKFLAILLVINVLWFGLESLISAACGFIAFLCLVSSIVPKNKNE